MLRPVVAVALALVLGGCTMMARPLPWVAAPGTGTVPPFEASTTEMDIDLAKRMTRSWHSGCPVPLKDLAHIRASHWGFDGRVHAGELVVHRDHADDLVTVLRRLFEARFPIERMELVDAYGGDDRRSMAANNTSAFNCRTIADRPEAWSQHAFGRAIDINPVQNPFVLADGRVLPEEGKNYLERDPDVPGLIVAGDEVVEAFGAVGWTWGGEWAVPDYQHFSAPGT